MAFRNALTIRRQTLSHRDVKISRLLNNIGCCLFELGEMNKADVAFEEALKIQRINMKNTKKSITVNIISNQNSGRNAAAGSIQQNLFSIASTLCNIGSIQLRLKQYEEAAVCLEEALLIQQSVWGDGHATAANTKDSLDFVNKKRNCGKATSESLQDLILRKMEQVGLSSASGGSTYRVPNPLGIFSDVMTMDKTEWIQVLEDFGGVPVLCKGSAQTPEVATTSSSDSLEGDLHWI
jgi:tetratricopeptide (TPR) repeat protein